ncbi:SagB/ThcOx family dehydrogenase [Methylocystis sp. JAN1]|uniref:SagB/ThcOx family dehydrogenase n=1 Tax=Methylocystis sp. JAN1 TaxID=3397211 RepID=UPI003FA1DED7
MNAHPDALPADIRDYHSRTKHAPTRYALGPAFLDWTSQPSPYRRFDGARLIELPLSDGPATSFPGPAAAAAPFDPTSLGLFLELALGLSAWKSAEGSTWAVRNNPSSGNLHPTEAYLLINALCGDAAAGLFHYAPLAHGLEERARYETASILPDGGFLVALSSIPWRESWKYGERAFRYCQLDAGHAIGAVAQAAAALGWRAQAAASPSDDDIAALIGLDRHDACHRREEEHPDLLLWVAIDGEAAPAIDMEAILNAPRGFHGAANRLSDDHDGWPIVDRALRLCRKRGTAPPAPAPARLPAAPFAGPAIGEVVRARRSVQRMDGEAVLSLDAFRRICAATLPSAAPLLSVFPWRPRLTLLLYVHRVEGLEPGLYLLARQEDAVSRLRQALSADFAWAPTGLTSLPLFRLRAGAVEREATRAACLQPIAGKGCFAVAMIADFEGALSEEGASAYRRLHWEAGLIGQALYLWATAAGLAGTGIGCFFDDEVHASLGLASGDMRFQDVYHFTVGGAVEDPRILTLPPYPDERRRRP